MRKSLFILIILTVSLTSFAQSTIDKNYIVLIFDIKQNDNLHPGRISYWIAESDMINEKSTFNFFPFFLSLFYTSDAYDNCCLGKTSNFYSFTTASKFEFNEEFEKKQEIFREFLKSNARKIQTVKKQWSNGKKAIVTISAIPIRAKICSCLISDNNKYKFESVALPVSDFEIDDKFWKSKNASYVEMDYSGFESGY